MDQTDGPAREEVKRSKPMDRIAADAAKREQERVAKGEEFTCLLMVFSLLFVVTIAAAGRDALVKLSRGEKVRLGEGLVGLLCLVAFVVIIIYSPKVLGRSDDGPQSTPATPTKLCGGCQQKKNEDDYSKKQWKARSDEHRRCIACATPAAAGPTSEQRDLVERLLQAASQRSSLDAEAENEARRRRLRRTHRRAERAERAAAAREEDELRAERRAQRDRFERRVTAALRAVANNPRRGHFHTPRSWSFHPVGGTSTLYASDDMIEHIRVLEEAFGPNLPQILRQLQEGVHIVGCRVVDEVPSNATPLR